MAEFLPKAAMQYERSRSRYVSNHTLEGIVAQMPPKLKQAMYAATSFPGGLKAGTWSNCAFNVAGREIDVHVSSVEKAAATFGVSTTLVHRFINKWDSMGAMSDQRRTTILTEALLMAGLTKEPVGNESSHGTKVISGVVFKGTQSEFIEALANVETLADIPGFTTDDECAVGELLGIG